MQALLAVVFDGLASGGREPTGELYLSSRWSPGHLLGVQEGRVAWVAPGGLGHPAARTDLAHGGGRGQIEREFAAAAVVTGHPRDLIWYEPDPQAPHLAHRAHQRWPSLLDRPRSRGRTCCVEWRTGPTS